MPPVVCVIFIEYIPGGGLHQDHSLGRYREGGVGLRRTGGGAKGEKKGQGKKKSGKGMIFFHRKLRNSMI